MRRHRSIVALIASAALTLGAGTAAAQSTPARPADMTDAERRALATTFLRALDAAYEGDPAPLSAMSATDALAALTATDWRLGLATLGTVRFDGDLDAGATYEAELVYDARGVVRTGIELRIDAAPGFRMVDATSGETLEVATGATWWRLGVSFARDTVDGPWRLVDAGPGSEIDLRFAPLPAASPCPWTPDDRRPTGADPVLLGPWCTVDGRGRRLPSGDDVPRRAEGAIDTFAGPDHCDWQSARFLAVGWPIGSVIDPWNRHVYVRDPGAVVARQGGFARDVDLPADAVSTGITNGRATIWVSDRIGPRAIFVRIDGRVERWPRTWAGCA